MSIHNVEEVKKKLLHDWLHPEPPQPTKTPTTPEPETPDPPSTPPKPSEFEPIIATDNFKLVDPNEFDCPEITKSFFNIVIPDGDPLEDEHVAEVTSLVDFDLDAIKNGLVVSKYHAQRLRRQNKSEYRPILRPRSRAAINLALLMFKVGNKMLEDTYQFEFNRPLDPQDPSDNLAFYQIRRYNEYRKSKRNKTNEKK